MPKNLVKRTMTVVVDIEATEGTTDKFFESLAKNLKRQHFVEDGVYDADPTDFVKAPGDGVVKVRMVSVTFS